MTFKIGDYVKEPYRFKEEHPFSYFLYRVEKEADEKGFLWVNGVSYSTGVHQDKVIPMTQEDIDKFEAEKTRIENNQKQREERENKLLEKISLTRSDFCRFRGIEENESGLITVCTRENGVNGFSGDAVKSPLFKTRYNDEGDSTYAYYEFMIVGEEL